MTGKNVASGRAKPNGTTVYEFSKSRSEVVRATLKQYNGQTYADVRVHYWAEDGEAEALAPTKKGITIRLDQLPELKAAIDALCAAGGRSRP